MASGGGVGPCRGDWGAPAVVIRDNQPILVGMVSFGRGCGLNDFGSVYVNVKSFTSWILEFSTELAKGEKCKLNIRIKNNGKIDWSQIYLFTVHVCLFLRENLS